MKRFCAMLCLLCVLLSCGAAYAQPANELLSNGGFEALDGAGDPVDWFSTAYRTQPGYSRLTVTTKKAHSGQHSALIENAAANDARFTCTVAVEPSSLYRLSGYILVESMEDIGNGANLAIEGIYAFSDCLFEPSDDWRYVEWYGETGEAQTQLTFGVRVGGYGAESIGKAYFDDISLQKVEGLPVGAYADPWYEEPAQEPASVNTNTSSSGEKSTALFVLLGCVFCLLYLLARPMLASRSKEKFALLAFLGVLTVALIARIVLACNVPGYSVDINCFTAWSMRVAEVGPSGFYEEGYFCDYPPGYILLLWPCGVLLRSVGLSNTPMALLIVKSLPILCDLLGAILLFCFAKKRTSAWSAVLLAALYALNPSVLVNGAAWGQADSVLALLMLLVVLFTCKRDWRAVLPLFTLSVLVKPQALLFAPVGVAFLLLCFVFKQTKEERRKQLRSLLVGAGLSLIAAAVIIVPFSVGQEPGWLFALYGETLGSYAYATLNTANLYYLAGANWTALGTKLPVALPRITALICVLAGVLCFAKPKAERTRKRVALGVLLVCTALIQVCLEIFSTNYSAYGYCMMAFAFAYAIVCLIFEENKDALPFYLALALIGVYVLGIKVHERYLFPAIPLLIMAYMLSRDRRLLLLCVGFSITTFINTAIVLDNAILFGATQGHLNNDTLVLNDLLCVLNLLLCGYAGWVGFTGLSESAPIQTEAPSSAVPPSYERMVLAPQDARMHLRLKDYALMAATVVLYGVLAFANLGSTVAPQTGWISSSTDEQVVFDLGESHTFSVLYYAGVSYNDFAISVSEDGETWSEVYPCRMREGLCYRWLYALSSQGSASAATYASDSPESVLWFEGRYLRLHAQQPGLNLWEIVARDEDGQNLPMTIVSHIGANTALIDDPQPVENLIDERDTCIGEPGWYNGTYFDEIYHARTGYEHLHGQAPYETTHPPLGKLMMSVGIAIFGMTPFGWRFAGALIGVLMLPALYLLGMQLTHKRTVATVAMLAFALDLMHYTQTRIATIDSFPVFFILLSYLFMVRYMQSDAFALSDPEKPKLLDRAYLRSLLPLLLCGLCMGLSIASKWIGLYSAVGLALLFFLTIYRHYRASNIACGMDANAHGVSDEQRARIKLAQEMTLPRILLTCGFCVLFFIVIPCVIYFLCYIPYLTPTGPVTLERVIKAQEGMLSYHSTPGLGMDHPFQSPWWQWPFILKPIWFAQDSYEPVGFASTIMCMGNPWVFYIGAFAILGVMIAFVCKYLRFGHILGIRQGNGDLTLCVIVVGFLAQYLPWMLVPRSMYIYHYFASVPFIILATAWWLDRIPDTRPKLKRSILCLYLVGALVFFVLFFPYASGCLTGTDWLDAMKWFSKLYY